jgi:hypothetical protein
MDFSPGMRRVSSPERIRSDFPPIHVDTVHIGDCPGSTAGDIAKMSKGVRLAANYDGQGYAMVTKHNNGTKQYGSADDSTALFSEVVDKTAAPETPGSSTNGFFGTGWTSM